MKALLVFNIQKILREKKRKIGIAQRALDIQVVKDSNYYCPEMDGTLKRSALRSEYGSGNIKWDTVYANAQYYGNPNKSRDKNPNARMMWFEEAKATKKTNWLRLANDKYNK